MSRAIGISEDKDHNDKLGLFNLPDNVGHPLDAVSIGVGQPEMEYEYESTAWIMDSPSLPST